MSKRFGVGCSSKPSGKLALSKIRSSACPPSRLNDTISDPGSADLPLVNPVPGPVVGGGASAVPAPVSTARGAAPTHLEGYKGCSRPVPSSVLSEPTPPAELSFSFTDSDLLSNNSNLKTSFPSLPSSTQTSVASSNQKQPALSDPGMASNTFVTGAGPHCPQPSSDSDSSLIIRGNRGRNSRLRLTALMVLGRNFGSHVLSALRMAFKSYEPAVTLTRVNLKGPAYAEDGAQLERFAHNIMDTGEVDRAEDLYILCEVLHFTHEVLKKVLSRESEVRTRLPAQKVADFAPNGPVMTELRKVIEEVQKLEADYQAENEVLAAEFDADSFQMEESILTDGESCAVSKEAQVEPEPVKKRSGEMAEPDEERLGEMVEPDKKRSRPSLEGSRDDVQEPRSVFLEEELKKPAILNKTLAETGAAALNRFQK